jgi:murein DD-endopeptidase MepM/ murein hydrolase activator NlpD
MKFSHRAFFNANGATQQFLFWFYSRYSPVRGIRVNVFPSLNGFLRGFRLLRVLILIPLALAACQASSPTPLPTSSPLLPDSSPTPASLPLPIPPAVTPTASNPMTFLLPTPGAEPVTAWRPPLYPSPWAPTLYDHFYFARPIAADKVNWPLPNYRYGGILEERSAHTGIDISVPYGTEVLAAGPGTVIWSGWGVTSSDPGDRSDPYGKAIVIRHDFGYRDQPLFTIYAHLSETEAVLGQWVNTGGLIGYVGETGLTTGPHLHFEVRVGTNGFFATRNPELWLVPPQGWGILVARIMDTAKETLNSYAILLHSEATGETLPARTYGPGTIQPDPYYHENLVLSDLPAGLYRIQIPFAGLNYETGIQILPGQVTFISFQGFLGFDPTPPATPVNAYFLTPAP